MKYLISILIFFINISIFCQEPQFSQYYANKLYLSPSFAGTDNAPRLFMNYRNQYMGLVNYNTYSASFDTYFDKFNSGIGALFVGDAAGYETYNTYSANIIYSYRIHIRGNVYSTFGLQGNYTQIGVDFFKLIFNDQIQTHSGGTIETPITTVKFFDVSSGWIIYGNKFWTGLSTDHLLRPEYALTARESSRLPIQYKFFGGLKLSTNPNVFKNSNYYYLTFLYKRQGNYNQLDLGVYWEYKPITFGIWYRGFPIFENINKVNPDAIIGMVGLRMDNFHVGYSYDFIISNLYGSTSGTHEITVSYIFPEIKFKSSKHKSLPCPEI
jgi:type IX secretion system PorP/SprF family membrane protein